MKVFVFVFFILCLGFSIIESININCQFKTYDWNVLGEVNYCLAENQGNIITDQSNRYVDTINESAIANSSIKLVYIDDSNCFYLPFGLEKRFPNLEGIVINNSKLKEIRREDFKHYKNLRVLDLENNEIEFLEPNLFEFVPKLEFIWLTSNKIAHIDANVFNNFVGKLSYLMLSSNICKFENARDDKSKTNEIIEKVQSGSCKDETLLPISVQFVSLTKLIENLQVSMMQEAKALNGKLATLNDKLEEQNSEFKSEIMVIKAGLSNITAQFEKPENVVGFDLEDYNQP